MAFDFEQGGVSWCTEFIELMRWFGALVSFSVGRQNPLEVDWQEYCKGTLLSLSEALI